MVVTNLGTNQHLTATTDEDGRFRFSYVPVGDYRLLVECGGFSPAGVRLTLTVGQAADVRITLSTNAFRSAVMWRACRYLALTADGGRYRAPCPRFYTGFSGNG